MITTLPQLIWAIAFLLSTLMGSEDYPGSRGVEQLQLFGSPPYAMLPRFGRPHNDQQRRFVASTRIISWRLRQDSNLQPRDLLTFHIVDTLAGALAHVGEGAAA